MSGIFIGFILVIILLVLLVCVISIRTDNKTGQENELYNDEGFHLYYDRSIIEKKEFHKEHPEIKNVRSLRRLIKEFRNK